MKVMIFDSGPIINLALNGLLDVLEKLKKSFDGKFIITESVKYETVDRPIGIPRFELEALKIQELIDKGVLEMSSSLGIDNDLIKKRTQELKDIANHYLQVKGKWVQIVSDGEMSCLALSAELTKKGITNIIGIDERTTRILCENPENLGKLMSDKLHTPASLIAKDFSIFSKFSIIRSPEIVYSAYKKGLVSFDSKRTLEALLYATKYHGSSISFEEIDELKRL